MAAAPRAMITASVADKPVATEVACWLGDETWALLGLNGAIVLDCGDTPCCGVAVVVLTVVVTVVTPPEEVAPCPA